MKSRSGVWRSNRFNDISLPIIDRERGRVVVLNEDNVLPFHTGTARVRTGERDGKCGSGRCFIAASGCRWWDGGTHRDG